MNEIPRQSVHPIIPTNKQRYAAITRQYVHWSVGSAAFISLYKHKQYRNYKTICPPYHINKQTKIGRHNETVCPLVRWTVFTPLYKQTNKCNNKKLFPLYPELLKVEDLKTHICAKFSRIWGKFRLLSTKLEKKQLLIQSDIVLQIEPVL